MIQTKLAILLFLCLVLTSASNDTICTNGFTLVNNKCWKLFQEPANHTAAEKTCSSFGGTLFITKNAVDNKAFESFVNSSGIDTFWMGLFCFGNHKSQCLFDVGNDTSFDYANFAPGYPNIGAGRCVYYSVSGGPPRGQWINANCKLKRAYVCELPPTRPDICDFNFNNNCYFFLHRQSFDDARMTCRQMCSELASIHSEDENRYITSMALQNSILFPYIGGIATSEKSFVWVDGSLVDYSNFQARQSGDRCLRISTFETSWYTPPGAWYSGGCTPQADFICKRPAGEINCSGTPSPPTIAPQPTQSCAQGTHIAPGTIFSPNFPLQYKTGCTYTLVTSGASKIDIWFNYVKTYNESDSIYIYDGDSKNAPLLGKVDGRSRWDLTFYLSTGNIMFIEFVYGSSDNSGYYTGFNASFYSVSNLNY